MSVFLVSKHEHIIYEYGEIKWRKCPLHGSIKE